MRLIVIASHKTSYPNPIHFAPGDRLKLGRRDDQYPGWIWVTTPDGNEGWAPESLIRAETDRNGISLADYTAKELVTTVGEIVVSSHELNGWLWVQNDRGDSGWIPKETTTSSE
jgi:hypothetical protein